jgi:hypothetical protein
MAALSSVVSDDPRRVSQGPNDVLNISSGRSEAERIGIA